MVYLVFEVYFPLAKLLNKFSITAFFLQKMTFLLQNLSIPPKTTNFVPLIS